MVVIESIVMEAVRFAIQCVFWANWTFVSSFAFGIAAMRSFRVAIAALLWYLSVDFCIHFSPPSLNRALPTLTNYRGRLRRCQIVKFSRLASIETELCPNDDQHIEPVSYEIDTNEIDAMNAEKRNRYLIAWHWAYLNVCDVHTTKFGMRKYRAETVLTVFSRFCKSCVVIFDLMLAKLLTRTV